MGRIRNESLKGSGRWILVLWEAPKEREKVGQLRCGRPGRQGVTSCRGWESSQKLLTGTGRQRTKRSANTWGNHDIDGAVLGALPLEVTEERCGCSLRLSAHCTQLSPTTVHTFSWPLPLGHACEWIKVIRNQISPPTSLPQQFLTFFTPRILWSKRNVSLRVETVSEIWLLYFIHSYFPWNTYTKGWEQNETTISHRHNYGQRDFISRTWAQLWGQWYSSLWQVWTLAVALWVWIGLVQRQEGRLAVLIPAGRVS